jgi:hypothetical protein
MTGEKLARRFVAREILRFEADSRMPVVATINRFEQLVKQVRTLPLRQREQETHRCVAEEASRYWMRDCEGVLEPDRFEHLVGRVNRLHPLKLEQAARRQMKNGSAIAAARAQDHARVYRSVFVGVNTRRLRRAMLPSDWCRDRDRAVKAASTALLKLRKVLSQNTADPGLLLLSFEGIEREFRRFLSEASPESPLDGDSYQGRAGVLRTLLSGSPARLGWVKGGRPAAVWQSRTRAELREQGVKGEALEGLIEAAGLEGKSPDPSPRPKPQTGRARRRSLRP